MRRPALPPRRTTGQIAHEPRPGFWLVRYRRDSPPMPASIQWSAIEPGSVPPNPLDTGPVLVANVGWENKDPIAVWVMRKDSVITKADYEYHMARVSWVKKHAPEEPEAAPTKPVALSELRPIGPTE